MNANNFKHVAWFVVGALIGAGVGYLVVDHILKNREEDEEMLQEELDYSGYDLATHKYAINNQEVTQEEYEEWLKPNHGKYQNASNEQPVLAKKPKVKSQKKPKVIDYSKISTQNQVKPSLENLALQHLGVAERADDEVEEGSEQDSAGVFVISFEDYVRETGHEKITFTYYKDDDTLCNENEEIIDNRDNLIGYLSLSKFGQDSGDPDTVYVRNMHVETDYEIVRIKGSYKVLVTGEPLEEVVKPPSKNSRHSRKVTKTNEKINDDDEDE